MKALPRSVMLLIASVPTTSTVPAEPARIMSWASPTPYEKPAQAAETSSAIGPEVPSRYARRLAAEGVWYRCVTVAPITASISPGVTPARSIAVRDACSAMSTTVSPGFAQRRLTIPDRSRIHWSEESIFSMISSLVTTRLGR